jgi:hypothetical protein
LERMAGMFSAQMMTRKTTQLDVHGVDHLFSGR